VRRTLAEHSRLPNAGLYAADHATGPIGDVAGDDRHPKPSQVVIARKWGDVLVGERCGDTRSTMVDHLAAMDRARLDKI
jgi:hypothetical protein